MWNVVRGDEGERGAVLLLTALLVPALVAVGALALGVTSLWTGTQDLQRAVDLGALAGAANTPTVSGELPIHGLELFQDIESPLDPSDWRQRPCEVTRRQLIDGRSIVSTAFAGDAELPLCAERWYPESPLLAALAACAADAAEVAGCAAVLEDELWATLPAVDELDASVQSAIGEVHALLDPADKLVTHALATQLGDACADGSAVTVLGITTWVCNHRVGDLLDAVDHRTGTLLGVVDARLQALVARLQQAAADGLLDPIADGTGFDARHVPQVGVDLAGAAPALFTPRLEVRWGAPMQPPLSPMKFDITTSATARRVIKSALVLPAVGVPGVDAWSELPAPVQNRLTQILGPWAATRLENAGRDGWIVDPNTLTARVPDVAERVLTMLDRLEVKVSAKVSSALCRSLPPTVACPVGDDLVDHEHVLGPFTEDLWDATRPPPRGTAPTVQDILGSYADRGEPLMIVAGLRPLRPRQLFGDVMDTLTNPTLSPVSPLLSELMFVPALDVVPAAVFREGDTFRIERLAATTGLYKARLVK